MAGDFDALLEEADDALRAADWPGATASYRAALELEENGEAWFGLGVARWWAGETQEALRCWERAYAAFSALPDRGQAAFTAVYLCLAYRMSLGNDAAARGWLERAASLVEEYELTPMQAWVLLCRAYVANDSGEPRTAELHAREALAMARASGDADLVLCATSELGAALVAVGAIDEGAALLDQIHVYGGDFVTQPRSQWGPGPLEERPYDIDDARRQFAAANESWRASMS